LSYRGSRGTFYGRATDHGKTYREGPTSTVYIGSAPSVPKSLFKYAEDQLGRVFPGRAPARSLLLTPRRVVRESCGAYLPNKTS
jgi:hypothetical protein